MNVLAAAGAGYALAGWAIVTVSLVAYVASVFQRARRVESQVPEGKRRWSDAS